MRRRTLHGDRVADRAHRLPRAPVAILRRVRRVRAVDVEILAVRVEDGEPPRSVLVVPDGDAGDHRLAAADHVPPRRDQVHEVAKRRRGDRAVRVVRHERAAAQGAMSADHPVVAADVTPAVPPLRGVQHLARGGERPRRLVLVAVLRHHVLWPEAEWRTVRLVEPENRGLERGAVEGRIEVESWLGTRVEPHPFSQQRCAVPRHESPVGELLLDVAEQSLVTGDHDVRRPPSGAGAEQPQLLRHEPWIPRRLVDERVHAVHERADDRRTARVVACEVGGQAAAIPEQARPDIALHLAGTEQLRNRARRPSSPDLELEGPVARGGIALREEQVVLGAGVDVRDAPGITQDLYRLAQPVHAQGVARWRLGGHEARARRDGEQRGRLARPQLRSLTPKYPRAAARVRRPA